LSKRYENDCCKGQANRRAYIEHVKAAAAAAAAAAACSVSKHKFLQFCTVKFPDKKNDSTKCDRALKWPHPSASPCLDSSSSNGQERDVVVVFDVVVCFAVWLCRSVKQWQIVEAEATLSLHSVIHGDDVVNSGYETNDSDYEQHEDSAELGLKCLQYDSDNAKTETDEKQNK